MSINPSWARMFIELEKQHDFGPRVLTIGTQDMTMSHQEAEELLADCGRPYESIPETARRYKQSKAQRQRTPVTLHPCV